MTDEESCRQVILGRTDQVCELCRSARWTEKHHVTNRSQGGTWDPQIVIGLCTPCHGWITVNPHLAQTGGWHQPPAVPAGRPIWLASLTLYPGWFTLDADGTAHPVLDWRPPPAAFPDHFPASLRPPARITVIQRSHP